jgi:flagellin
MSLNISSNLYAMSAANNLSQTYSRMGKSIDRLSSGERISSASDDPTGLAVREQLRADIGVLHQGISNAQYAITMLETADGAMSVIDEKLVRMKELAEQAATGTYTHAQRQILHSEFAAMAAEIDRIAEETEFAGVKLLNGDLSTNATNNFTTGGWLQSGNAGLTEENYQENGEFGNNVGVKIHFGTSNSRLEDYYFINIGDMSTNGLFRNIGEQGVAAADKISISTQEMAQKALDQIDSAIFEKDKARAYLGTMMERLENTISALTNEYENLSAAESQISDVDVAAEMTEYVKDQVMMQAGIAMLSQANSLPNMALSLLQG